MYKILFVGALAGELNLVKQKVKEIDKKGVKSDFLLVGMGNYEVIYNLTKYLDQKTPDFIVNIGVCGYKNTKNDLIQVVRSFNSSIEKEILVPVFFSFSNLESIFCSEKPISYSNFLGDENYVDMESYGVEFVCDKFKIPRIILKVPVDKIGIETKNFNKEKAIKLLGNNINYKSLIENIVYFLYKIPKKNDLSKYFEFYNMTFSEKIIFEKLYNEYNIFTKVSFEEFFKNNKKLTKKDFFSKLTSNSKINKKI